MIAERHGGVSVGRGRGRAGSPGARPRPAARAASPERPSRSASSSTRAALGTGTGRRSSTYLRSTAPPSAGGSSARPSRSSAPSSVVSPIGQAVDHGGQLGAFGAQVLGGLQQIGDRRRVQGSRRRRAVCARARGQTRSSSLDAVLAPDLALLGAATRAALRGARSSSGRTIRPRRCGHALKRAATGRCEQSIEDRLGLIVGGVGDGDHGVLAQRLAAISSAAS